MPKQGILFVDDEPHILSGMKRLLRSLRHDYEFHFCESGKKALETMKDNIIDVVISDMKMPGMNGAELLIEIKMHYPNTIRIMLTGQADEESVYKSIDVVHQFLAKPCNPEKLKNVITRAASLHNLMSNSSLKEMITSIGSLPSMPAVYSKLQDVLKCPDVVADDVANVIELDMAITAKLLQLLNSSFFGLFNKVDTPARAVKLLGLDTIKILVLGLEIFSEIKTDPKIFSIDELWEHSLLVAKCSKAIAADTSDDLTIINDSYISGMLHDIGRLLLVSESPDTYYPILKLVKEEELSLIEEEHNFYGATHADAGAYLTSLWGFNADVIEAVALHDDFKSVSSDHFSPALAVHIANFFYYQHTPHNTLGLKPQLDIRYIETLGLSENINRWDSICEKIILDSRQ